MACATFDEVAQVAMCCRPRPCSLKSRWPTALHLLGFAMEPRGVFGLYVQPKLLQSIYVSSCLLSLRAWLPTSAAGHVHSSDTEQHQVVAVRCLVSSASVAAAVFRCEVTEGSGLGTVCELQTRHDEQLMFGVASIQTVMIFRPRRMTNSFHETETVNG